MTRAAARLTSAAALLSLAASLAIPLAASAASWKLARELTITHKVTVANFLDDEHGVTAGYAGTMYRTADGGKTWEPGVNRSMCRFGVEMVPGFAITSGNGGDVRGSTDGGATWTNLASFGGHEPNHARYLSFVDAQRGAIASPDHLGLTADGGRTWAQLPLPPQGGIVAGLALSEAKGAPVLRVLDDAGALWRSDDGGKTWAAAKSPLSKPLFESLAPPYAALRFTGEEGVLAAIVDEGGAPVGHVYRTRDGGNAWSEEAVADGLKPSAVTLSADGKLLTSFDRGTLRIYRAE